MGFLFLCVSVFLIVPLVNARLHNDYLKLHKEECNSRPFFFYTPGITQCAVTAVFYCAIAFNVAYCAMAAVFYCAIALYVAYGAMASVFYGTIAFNVAYGTMAAVFNGTIAFNVARGAVAAIFYGAIAFNVTCCTVAARFNGLCFCAYPAKSKGSDKEKFFHDLKRI